MNVFKGLLYLIENDTPASPVLIQASRFGAATAANGFGGELGNRAASQRRFGASPEPRRSNDGACMAAVGGCR